MLKILMCSVVFFAGIALGGGLRYNQVEAQLSAVEIQNVLVPSAGAQLGATGGGSCG